MPSIETDNSQEVETTKQPKMPEKEAALLDVAADVEELVAAIKHNLRLKSRSCHSYCSKQKRVSPYEVPPGRTSSSRCGSVVASANNNNNNHHHSKMTKCDCGLCATNNNNNNNIKSHHHHHRQKTVQSLDDPYEMLQVLLREGSLIKEAVKRLQLGGAGAASGDEIPSNKANIDFYEYDCSVCDLPSNNPVATNNSAPRTALEL